MKANEMEKTCSMCGSHRLALISGKCRDTCEFWMLSNPEKYHEGYVPVGIGLGSDSKYLQIIYCLDCGQIQKGFPVPAERVETILNEAEEFRNEYG